MQAPETQADRVLRKFGGAQRIEEVTGISRLTVKSWPNSGNVPHKYWPVLLAAAQRHGIDHSPWDYIAHLVGAFPGPTNVADSPRVAGESTPA